MNGELIGAIVLWLIVAVIVIAVVVWLLNWLYHRSTKEMSFVRTGFGGEKVVINGGALVLPIVHEVTPVNMNVLRLAVARSREDAVITRDRMRVDIEAEFFVRVAPSKTAVATAAATLGRRTMEPERLSDLMIGKFVSSLRSVAAEMTLDDMHERRSDYVAAVTARTADVLASNGLELESVAITNLDQTDLDHFNPANRFDAEGLTQLIAAIEDRRKIRNDIEQSAMLAIRARNLDSEKETLDLERESTTARLNQERAIEALRAAQSAEIMADRAAREAEATVARIQHEQSTNQREISRRQAIDAAEIAARQETEQRRIAHEQAVEAARIERDKMIRAQQIAERQFTETAEIAAQEEVERRRIAHEQALEAARIERNRLIHADQVAERQASEAAEIAARQDVERRRIEQEQTIETARIDRDKAVRAHQVAERQASEAAEISANRELETARIQAEHLLRTARISAEEESESREIERTRMIDSAQIAIRQEVDTARIDYERALDRARTEREKALKALQIGERQASERAEIDAREEIERARIDTDRSLEEARILRDRDIRILEVERSRTIELAEIERQIVVLQKRAAESAARAQTEDIRRQAAVAEETVATAREMEIANRIASVDRLIAQKNADTTKIAAEAERVRSETAAEAERLLNRAENILTDDARAGRLRARLLDRLEGIVRESVRPIEKIDGIKILHVEGLGGSDGGKRSPTDEVIESALRYRAQAPLIDEMMREIGIEGSNVSRMGDVFRAARDAQSIAKEARPAKSAKDE